MKILLVNDYKDEIGGAELYMYTLKDKLEEDGHRVRVFTSDVSAKEYYQSLSKTSYIRLLKKLFNVQAYWRFKQVVDVFQPDVIHIQSPYNELSPSILLATGKARVLLTVHDQRLYAAVTNQKVRNGRMCEKELCVGCVNCVGLLGSWYANLRWFVHKPLYNKVDTFLFPSRYMLNLFESETVLDNLVHLPNGFKLPRSSKVPHIKRVVFLGRVTRDKGIDLLLQAWKHVVKQVSEARLDIVGEGELLVSLQNLAKDLKIDSSLVFHGKLPHDEAVKVMRKADFVCIPSRYPDNLPTVAIEALAIGRPIIASKVGGLPEMVKDGRNGYLVDSESAEDVRKAIMNLLNNTNLVDKMASNSASKSKRYSIREHWKRLQQFYF